MSVVVGTLTIDLKANTAAFSQSMDKMAHLSAKSANDIKRSLERIAAAGVAMAASIAGVTVAAVKTSLDAADAMGKLAQSAGTTSEKLSVMSYAAKLSGLQNDQLGVGLVRLSKAAFGAQNGNLQLERVFGRLGVTVLDSNGKLKDSGDLMGEVSKKFSGLADGSGKTAVALQLFGKSGAAMIPFLDLFGAKQARINADAHAFGLEVSTSTTQLAASAKEKLGGLQEVFKGLGFAVLGATLPAMTQLEDKLMQIAKDANLPDLAKKFGAEVSSAVNVLGDSLDFAATHAHALKIALEALAGVQIAKIAIPLIGDLADGKDLAKIGKGFDRATMGLLGLERTLPVLAKFGKWAKESAQFARLLATEEGIASAATYVLTGALSLLEAPLILSGIAALGFSFFKVAEGIREARDEGVRFSDVLHGLVDHGGANLFKLGLGDASGLALSIEKSARPHTLPTRFFQTMNPLDSSKNKPSQKNSLDTSGLSGHANYFADEIRKLDQGIATQKAYLAVIDGTPEKIQAVNAAEQAHAAILALNKQLTDEGMAALSKRQQGMILGRMATQAETKALVDYGRSLVDQQHASELSIEQAKVLALANLQGDMAVRRATIDNAILGLTYNRTAAQIRTMAPELEKLQALMTSNASAQMVASTNKEIDGLRQQLMQRNLVTAATMQSIDAQRQAALASSLVPLNRDISGSTDKEKQALLAKRDALVRVAQAEWAASDAQAALTLRSPAEQYDAEADGLAHAVAALRRLQGGSLSYGQQLQVTAREQDNFNRVTDQTIDLMLRFGSAGDGVKAFFLEMQKQAKTTAATIYDAFNESFNKISQGFTDVLTSNNKWQRGQAWNQFGQMFDDLGKQLLNSTIKKGMQESLGKLGGSLGIHLPGLGSKPDGSTAASALWVRMASDSGSELTQFGVPNSTAGSAAGVLGSLFGGRKGTPSTGISTMNELNDLMPREKTSPAATAAGSSGTGLVTASNAITQLIGKLGTSFDGLFSKLGSMFSGIFAGGGSSAAGGAGGVISTVVSALIPHAAGGPVNPNSAYLVGERGPEILTGASGRIFSNADSSRMLSSGSTTHSGDTHFHVDARGSNDPAQVEAHVNRALRAAAPQIAAMGVHAMRSQQQRQPLSRR